MESLITTVALASLYAIGISYGIGRELDNHIVTRPLVVAGGIAIVVIGKTWGDWSEAVDWFLWFSLASLPLMLRSAIIHINAEKRAALLSEQDKAKKDTENAIRARVAD